MKKIVIAFTLLVSISLFSQNTIEKKIGEFEEVKAFDLINVTMIKSDENKVIILGKNKRNVRIINKNGKLKIRMELEESYDGNDTKVTLYYTDVDIIDANEGAKIIMKETLNKYDIKFKAQEGGEIIADIKSNYADVRAVTGGVINLTGTSKNLDVSIYTGGQFEGKDLKTESTEVSIKSVFIYGNPKEIDQKTVLGGKVKRM